MATPRREKIESSDDAAESKKLLTLLSFDVEASRMFQRFMSPSRGSLSVGFENIIKLDLPNCKLTESNLPATLPGTLPNLENSIGNCVNMRKLMLSGNALTSLPLTMANLTKLELIRLACNNLTSPPMSVLRLPNLKWVALGSNPFTDKVAPPTVSKPKSIERSALEFGDVLGSGASGTTVEAVWNGKSVAVKQYKGTITSDGSPSHELAVNLCVGMLGCSSLVPVEGVCSGDLVMGLLEGYETIGGPPNFDTCTRDVYEEGRKVGADQAERAVNEVGECLRLLHAKGISHGDLYGHNILVKKGVGLGENEGCYEGGGFENISPRLYTAKTDMFRSWPRPVRIFVGYLTAVLFTLSFLTIPLLLILLSPSCWSNFESRMASTLILLLYASSIYASPKEWPAFRDLGQLWYSVFNFRFTTSPLSLRSQVSLGQESTSHFVMAMHPHGIVPLHAVLWSAFCNQFMTDGVTGASLYGFGAAADAVGYVPFLRNIMGWLSAGSASRDVLKRGLTKGDVPCVNLNGGRRPRHLFLLPGGVAEVFESAVGEHAVVFKGRRGLIRLSLECGCEVMPCYVFGGTDFFHNAIKGDTWAAKAARKLKMGLTFFWGHLGMPFLPFTPSVTICVGDVVDCKGWDGSEEEVERKHSEYLDKLEELFEKYKKVAGYEEAVLEIK
ncbi:hypothetical protein TrRE_jg7489 [Triparma retinervis]|uniref:diacylglycerol O-acyltransferase n=1 Tax=Triparma retinervis TaxID=2557542 RepID=A0A9W7DYQ6_9STRA|nr:hypothetical protein TrRE_jg7489 [Triparma retinervis]